MYKRKINSIILEVNPQSYWDILTSVSDDTRSRQKKNVRIVDELSNINIKLDLMDIYRTLYLAIAELSSFQMNEAHLSRIHYILATGNAQQIWKDWKYTDCFL